MIATDAACSDTCEPVGYRRLAELLGVLLAEQHVDAVLKRIAETLRQLVHCDDLVIWEALSADQLRPALVEGQDAEQLQRLQIRIGEGITGHACLLREPICSNRADLDPRAGHVPGTDAEPEAIVCLPLLARSELLGALSLYRTGFEGFTDTEFELIRHFAEVAALALANARSRAELETLARTDDLTGLANRRHLKEQLARELTRATHHRRPLSLLLLDLDDFKQINDSQGHHAGDMVLRQIADILLQSLRQQDLAARLGGDEFALLLPNTDNDKAQTVSRRLVEVVHAQTAVHISTGIATFASNAVTDLLRVADRDLYESKGRNQPWRGRRARDSEGMTSATNGLTSPGSATPLGDGPPRRCADETPCSGHARALSKTKGSAAMSDLKMGQKAGDRSGAHEAPRAAGASANGKERL